jgi:hypothetical protein
MTDCALKGASAVLMESVGTYVPSSNDIHALDHVQIIGLQDERSAGVIQHSGSVLQLLEVFQTSPDLVCHFEQPILFRSVKRKV